MDDNFGLGVMAAVAVLAAVWFAIRKIRGPLPPPPPPTVEDDEQREEP